jgi:hypothetical protein
MRLAVGSLRLAVISRIVALCCLLPTAYCELACSIPSLEKPQCTTARDTVKRFYSFHFGNDMRPSPENLKAREQFLTSDLVKALSSASTETSKDYFTATDNYPKAFRVGLCTSDSDDKATLQVLLLWRDDTKNEQKEVHVETVKTGDAWLINKVSN